MTQAAGSLTIGALAAAAGVGVETVRFYQRKKLLREPRRIYGGIRRYGPADVTRVGFVKSAQGLGFSLAEVAQLLRLDDGAHCTEAADLAAARLVDVRRRFAQLRRMEAVLAELIDRCRAHRGKVLCPLIASLQRI